jgi:excisionase family DNA binding protein
MERRFGPDDRDYFTAEEVATQLGVSVDTLIRMVREREFPPPVPMPGRGHKWPCMDVVMYGYLKMRLGDLSALIARLDEVPDEEKK